MNGKRMKSSAGRGGPNPLTHDTTPPITPSAANKANVAETPTPVEREASATGAEGTGAAPKRKRPWRVRHTLWRRARKAYTACHGRMPALRELSRWLRRVVTDAIDFRRRAAKTKAEDGEPVIIAPADGTDRYLATARAEGYESVSSSASAVLDEAAWETAREQRPTGRTIDTPYGTTVDRSGDDWAFAFAMAVEVTQMVHKHTAPVVLSRDDAQRCLRATAGNVGLESLIPYLDDAPANSIGIGTIESIDTPFEGPHVFADPSDIEPTLRRKLNVDAIVASRVR